jgi:predicted type IV restriction endonuclease
MLSQITFQSEAKVTKSPRKNYLATIPVRYAQKPSITKRTKKIAPFVREL